jgi:transposase InsO family protein
LAVLEPTIGCRQYADRFGDRGFAIAKSTVQKILVTHGLGRRAARLARSATITAATTGLVTEAQRKDEPFGFCLATAGPGELVCLDSFYVGKLKGVGKVYQLTAVDVFTRWAVVMIVLGPVSGAHTIALHRPRSALTIGATASRVRAVLSDNGPEYVVGAVSAHLAAKGLRHERIPPRSPNHNAVCERFHRHHPPRVLAAGLPPPTLHLDPPAPSRTDSWLITYHRRRRNHGDYMARSAPRIRSSTTTREIRQHENHHPQRPSVTSTPGPEALGVAVIGSVLSTRYQHTLEPALAGRHVPAVAAQAILGSLGGALAVARIVSGSLGAVLAHVARVGFALGTHSAFLVAAGVTGTGALLILAALPSRPPPEETAHNRERQPGSGEPAVPCPTSHDGKG